MATCTVIGCAVCGWRMESDRLRGVVAQIDPPTVVLANGAEVGNEHPVANRIDAGSSRQPPFPISA